MSRFGLGLTDEEFWQREDEMEQNEREQWEEFDEETGKMVTVLVEDDDE